MPHPLLFLWQGAAEGGGGTPDPEVSTGGSWAHAPIRLARQPSRPVDLDPGPIIVEPGQTKDDT